MPLAILIGRFSMVEVGLCPERPAGGCEAVSSPRWLLHVGLKPCFVDVEPLDYPFSSDLLLGS